MPKFTSNSEDALAEALDRMRLDRDSCLQREEQLMEAISSALSEAAQNGSLTYQQLHRIFDPVLLEE